ncbi:hypothetical protein EJB05_57504, partial [Eragrostis curvula]
MFGDGPRNPRWLPPGVENVPEDLVEKRLWAILESTKQEKPEGFPLLYSAANPAEKDMFGPDPSEGGADNTMVLESSSSKKEPREPPKKSSAEVFADMVLNSPDALRGSADSSSEATISSEACCPESSTQLKPIAPPRTRSSKAKLSEEPPKIQLQPARKRKLKSAATTSVTPSTELPAVRNNPNLGD